MQRRVLRVCLANPRAVPCDPAVKSALAAARILNRRPAKSLGDVLGKRVGELSQRAAKKRKESPPREPIVNPTYDQIEYGGINVSLGNGYSNGLDEFHRSFIINGKHYACTSSMSCSGGGVGHLSEFELVELIPAYLPRAAGKTIVGRDGTSELYALGERAYLRFRGNFRADSRGTLHSKPFKF
jgi:hypothetical protein